MRNSNHKASITLALVCSVLPVTNGWSQPVRNFSTGLASGDTAPRPRSILYLGRAEASFHNPVNFYEQYRRLFAERGLKFTFTNNISDLNTEVLSKHDCLFMYGDVQTSGASSEPFGRPFVNAIIDYVEGGGGLSGMHVAAACFRNSTDFERLLGGRFLGHYPYQSFTPGVPNLQSHPVTNGLGTYTSFDEPYQIKNLNPDVILLGTREGIGNEPDGLPYTWVRTQGTGRVFYHANGHDESSWSQPNFQELMLRGTEWTTKIGSTDSFRDLQNVTFATGGNISFISEVEIDSSMKQGVFSGAADSPLRVSVSGEDLFDNSSAGSILKGSETSAVTLANGMVAMTTQITRAGVSGDSAAFLLGPPQCPHLIAASGLTCPAAGAGFTYAGTKEFKFETSDLDELVLHASLEDSNVTNHDAILLRSNGVHTTKILMEGDVLEQGSITINDLSGGDFALSDRGSLAVVCEIIESGETLSAIVSDRSGDLEVALRSGVQSANLPANSSIESFSWVEIRDNGEILLSANLTGSGVTSSNDQVLCRLSMTGEITVVMREGEQIDGGIIEAPADGWQGVCSESHLAVVTPYLGSGEAESVPALMLISSNSISRVLSEGDLFSEGDDQLRVKFIANEKASCEGSEAIMKIMLEDEADSSALGEALILLGRLQPRILVRTGWQLQTQNGPLLVDQLNFQPESHGKAGHSSDAGLVFVASAADGERQIVFSELPDSLDGDLLDDDLEIAFGGDANSGNGLPPAGLPQIQAQSNGALVLNFWVNESISAPYELYESADLQVWEKVETPLMIDVDQSEVSTGFQRFRHEIGNLEGGNFYRVKVSVNQRDVQFPF